MIIGVPKEIKNNENRIAITPAGVSMLVQNGHQVLLEANAGSGSGFSDMEYQAAGAKIVHTAKEVWAGDMVLKVKEPVAEEYGYLHENLILFTFLHLAANAELTKALVEHKVTAIGYETIQLSDGGLPLLAPMSEIAGRMSIQLGAQFLEKTNGGKGILLGGVPGVAPAEVVILGGGTVGVNAAKIALGMGASVTLLDINAVRLRKLDDQFNGRLKTIMSSSYTIKGAVENADLLIGAVLIPGARTPRLVTEEMVRSMRPGSVIVDVAVDQGGSIETIDRITTHSDPIYKKHNILHYAVANIPGAVPKTATMALTNVTIPYAVQIANKGYLPAAREDRALEKGINVTEGCVTYQSVAEVHGYEYVPVNTFFNKPFVKNGSI